MPKLNSIGKVCAGVGTGKASYEGSVLAEGAGWTSFLTDTVVVYQQCSDQCRLMRFDTATGFHTIISDHGATPFGAGGGVWAGWDGDFGLYASTGLHLPEAGWHAVGPDGAIAIMADAVTKTPSYVKEVDGSEWPLASGWVTSVHLLGDGKAVYLQNGVVKTAGGVPVPKIVEGSTEVRMATVGGVWYVLYKRPDGLMVVHPATNDSSPTVLHKEHVGTYYGMDLKAVSSRLYYAYATSVEEDPSQVVVGWIEAAQAGVSGGVPNTPGTPGTGTPGTGTGGTGSGGAANPSGTQVVGMKLTSWATYAIADISTATVEASLLSLPAWPVQQGRGRIVHPVLGAFDYEVKPDEWVNMDADVIVPPVWASTRTMTGASNVLWSGYLRDVMVEERWKALGGLAMPISQLRMLTMIWQNPVDPIVGYVEWWPNYISPLGFKVLPISLSAGGQQGLVFDDVVNYVDGNGPDGWMTNPVTFQLKIVDRMGS